jgi:hypothetical protein
MTILMKNEEILHKKFSEYGKNAKEWTRKCALLLPEIDRKRIWEKKGFSCIYEYAAKLAGMSRNTVRETIRIMEKVEDKPELRKVVEEKGINAIRPVATISTPETDKFWAEKAKQMSVRTLETYAKEYRNLSSQNLPCLKNKLSSKSHHVVTFEIELSRETTAKLAKLKGKNNWETLMKDLLRIREQSIEQEKPKTVKSQSRYIPAKINKYIIKKTNGQCAFPGCAKPCKIRHHADRFSVQREHNPERIIPLCQEHEQIAHLGLIRNEHLLPESWEIREQAETGTYKSKIDKVVQGYRVCR